MEVVLLLPLNYLVFTAFTRKPVGDGETEGGGREEEASVGT